MSPGPRGSFDPSQRRRIKPLAPTLGGRLRVFVAMRETRVYAESIVITALAPVIGWLVQRDDPLFLRNGFSWLTVPPVLIALRHGFGPGVTSALLLVVMVVLARKPGNVGLAGLPSELLYGVVLLTMIVGQVAAAMTRKFDKVEADYRRLRAQFDGFSRSYMLLELSHERLEQRAVSGLSSLRAALSSLFVTTSSASDRAELSTVCEKMLAVMATYGRVQGAGIHLVAEAGRLEVEPFASLGAPRRLLDADPLALAALTTGEVVHSPGLGDAAKTTELIAAVPLIDADGNRLGIVAIQALPFVALETSNLRLLFVVAGYGADAMSSSGGGEAARRDQWLQFEDRLGRATADAHDERVPSVLMAFWCKKAARGTEVLESLIAKDLRTTDFPTLRRDAADNPMLLIVMPLTDRDGTLAFRARIDRLSRERYGADLVALGVASRTWLLKDSNTAAILSEVDAALEAHEGEGLAAPPG